MLSIRNLIILVIACLLIAHLTSNTHAIPIQWGINGHYYEVIDASPASMTWEEARSIAASKSYMGLQGYLATTTSIQETQFLFGTFTGRFLYGLGGFQPSGSPEPAGGWQWITGESFVYTNWNPIEPNNSGGIENVIVSANWDRPPYGSWNDLGSTVRVVNGFFVEYGTYTDLGEGPGGSPPIPEPSTISLVGTGLIGILVLVRRKLRKR